jgi:SRSO17 transposase
MQHFITNSNWDEREVIDRSAIQTSQSLPKRKLTGLIIDETGTVKKGDMSVGVGWQYCGNVGKLANSQVAVMSCLSNGDFASMTDARLYLPEDWCNDQKRCDKVDIPQDHRIFKTKPEIAYDIVEHHNEIGVEFDFVGGDGLYGNDPELARKVNELGYVYMFDIHKDQHVFIEEPILEVPSPKQGKGRKPSLVKPDKQSIRVDRYCDTLSKDDWEEIKVRKTTKGTLKALFHFAKVFIWNQTANTIEPRLLVIKKQKKKNGEEIKYSFTNANLEQYTPKALAYMQGQRFFVEHCIKECKQVLGLDQFQTRKWSAWQHQLALNIMTACFILKEKLLCFDDLPLLSAWDIKAWICFKFNQQLSDDDMIDRMFVRHVKRQVDINRAYKKEGLANVSK